jgi:valacyclovir hydrolase
MTMPFFDFGGSRVFFREAGEHDAPLLIVLPGNTASSACHDGELAHFAARYHVAVPDLPGTGRSDRLETWPADWWGLGAKAVAFLVESLGGGPAVLVGCSGGAVVALLLAAARPELVRAVIADSGLGRLDPTALRAEVAHRRQRTPDQIEFWRSAQGDDWERVVEADSAFLLGLAERGGDAVGDSLGRVRCPVLLTGSARDDLVPDLAAGLVAMLCEFSDARAFIAGAGGHPLMWSRPSEFRAAVDTFLEQLKT